MFPALTKKLIVGIQPNHNLTRRNIPRRNTNSISMLKLRQAEHQLSRAEFKFLLFELIAGAGIASLYQCHQ
jgi:hypothetical protein